MSEKKNPIIRENCGTTKGWNAHMRNGEKTCGDCRKAKTEYTKLWRRRTGRTKSTLTPINLEEAA